jgi:hypothetical protein
VKEFKVEPGSGEWLQVRLGIPTASNFHKIVTPAKLEFSKQARSYAFRLVAERIMNESFDSIDHIDHVQRGKDLEPAAVQMFEFEQDIQTKTVGFLTTDDMRYGATPDRLLVGMNGALEIKCPSPAVHLEYLIDGFGADYVCQVQGQALVGEFDKVIRYSYHPVLPPRLQETPRDELVIKKLKDGLDQFCDMKDELFEKVREIGYFETHMGILTAYDEQVIQQMRE